MSEYRKAAQGAVDNALSTGADRAKVIATAGTSHRVVVEADELALANSSDDQKLAIGVHCDQKHGSSSTNSLESDAILESVKEARQLASFSVADKFLTQPPKQGEEKQLEGIYDQACEKVGLEDLREYADHARSIFSEYPKVSLDRYEIEAGDSTHVLSMSNGTVQQEKQTGVSWSFLALAKDGDDVSGMDYDGSFLFSIDGIKEKQEKQIRDFCLRVEENLGAGKCPSYNGAVVLSPRALVSLLISPIFYHASGRQIMDGKSRYENSLNEKIVSDKISIVDDPFDTSLSGATSYDSDGLATSKKILVENGVLKHHLFDCYSANRCKKEINGLAGGPFSLSISGGDVSLSDLLASEKRILYVHRFSGNNDPLTGDFSGVAKCSSLYENSQRVGAVQETMIAGNCFDLQNNVLAVSKEVENISGSYLSPHMLVGGVSVSS